MTGPRSLAEMALKVVLHNASEITDLSSLPSTYTTKILKAVKTATHLHSLELNSDDIYDQTPEHWKRLINRDFPILATRHKYEPPDPQSWYQVYERYKKLEDDAVAAATEKLSQGFAAVKEHRDSRQSTIVSGAQAPKLPRRKMVYEKPKLRRGNTSWVQQFRKDSNKQARLRFGIPKPDLMPIERQIRRAPEWMVREARERRMATASAGGPAAASTTASIARPSTALADPTPPTAAKPSTDASASCSDDDGKAGTGVQKKKVVNSLAAKFGHKRPRKYLEDAPECVVRRVSVPAKSADDSGSESADRQAKRARH